MDGQKKFWGVPIKTFLIIWCACLVGTAAVLPYAFSLESKAVESAPFSVPVLALISFTQSAFLFALATYFGLRLLKSTGYQLAPSAPYARLPILLGVLAGILILLAEKFFVTFAAFPGYFGGSVPNWWKGLLASLYGATGEEILLRLFLMTFIAWAISRTTGLSALAPSVAWIAIVISAILFGVGHLPAAAQLWPLSAVVITRTIVLNTIGGVIYGWLYWKRGLTAAMLAHFSTDIVLHVISALLPF